MKFILLLITLTASLFAQADLPREALLIGVGDYAGTTFKGDAVPSLPGITTADLPKMKAKLESLGFRVTVVADPTRRQAEAAVDAFSTRIKANPGVSLFYFSGHGSEFEGKNFLITKGASIGTPADLADTTINAQRILNGMEASGAPVNLVFLDCCREDLGKSVGGAEMAPLKARGSFIGFATRSGDFADPGADGSPYTRFLLKHLATPGVSVADMYSSVIADVKDYTKTKLGKERRPGFYSELDAPFFFAPVNFARLPQQPMIVVPPPVAANALDAGAVGKSVSVKLPGDVEVKFSFCPPGSFTMGDDKVPVRITKGFWMAQTELTQGQWQALMKTTIQDMAQQGTYSKEPKGVGATYPMHFVSWEDATAAITKLNATVTLPAGWAFALPSEAQWEYACRAGTTTEFAFGNTLTARQANFRDSKLEKSVPVSSYPPNAWGLYDMHGNMWELCGDWYAEKLAGGPDPTGAKSGASRVDRGGSWVYDAAYCRAAYRGDVVPGLRSDRVGFRPALVPSR